MQSYLFLFAIICHGLLSLSSVSAEGPDPNKMQKVHSRNYRPHSTYEEHPAGRISNAVGVDDPNAMPSPEEGEKEKTMYEKNFDQQRQNFCSNSPSANAIVKENCKKGNPSNEWDVNGAGDLSIQGYSTDISYNVGETAKFKINTNSTHYRIDIYRLGYYQGLGARKLETILPFVKLPQKQPKCVMHDGTHEYECSAWEVSAQWEIPLDTISGVFIARLVLLDGASKVWRTDNSQEGEDPRFAMPGGASMQKPIPQPHAYGALGHGKLRNPMKEPRASLIYFVVRNDASKSDVVVQTSDTVWQAYNNEGGHSTYGSGVPDHRKPRCYKASMNRPLHTRQIRPVNAYLGSEYPISRFLEANGYDVTYISGVDTDRYGDKLLCQHRLFLSIGHDEYWSGPQRKNVEAARAHGVHLGFFSGNEVYWRVRWEDNYRTMVVYKESQSLTKIDPNTTEWTGSWRDSRSINPLGPQPENALTGQIFTINAWRNDPLVIPYRFSRHRQWRSTKIARLQPGQRAVLFRGILGHEVDEDIDNGFRPKNMIHLSETEIDNAMYLMDFGSVFDSGSGTHHLTLYKTENGAMVFGAGTVQWGWALDGFHDSEHGVPANWVNHLNIRVGRDILAPENAIRQFTVNLFSDMEVFPQTLQQGLVPVEASHDKQPPECHINGPLQAQGDVLLLSVYAEDIGGGVVSTVEVMVDHNGKWRRMQRRSLSDEQGKEWVLNISLAGKRMGPKIDYHVWCLATDDSLNTMALPSKFSNLEYYRKREKNVEEEIGGGGEL